MRQVFECVKCKLRISGRVDARGLIIPYDRAANSDAPPKPCLCLTCARTVTEPLDWPVQA